MRYKMVYLQRINMLSQFNSISKGKATIPGIPGIQVIADDLKNSFVRSIWGDVIHNTSNPSPNLTRFMYQPIVFSH